MKKHTLNLLFIMLYCIASNSAFASPSYSDSMVRAAVVFGILRFTGWPEDRSPDSELVLCSVGHSSTIDAIKQIDNIPSIGKLQVSYYERGEADLEDCHATILGNGLPNDYRSTATLYICDECTSKAREHSGIVLEQGNQRIQFHINLDRVSEQRISLSSSLIELAASCKSKDPKIRGCHE